MRLRLDKSSSVPLGEQIARGIKAQIQAGILPAGSRLMSSRDLASELDVNRATVVHSYRDLKEQGLLESGVGRGTFVRPGWQEEDARGEAAADRLPVDWSARLTLQSFPSATPSVGPGRRKMVPLSRAVVHPSLFPWDDLQARLLSVMKETGPGILEYSSPAGYGPLRKALRARLARRGIDFERNEILIVNGSQQGLDLVARLLLQKRSVVLTSRPAFSGALGVFRLAGAVPHGVSMDADGMRIDELVSLIGTHRPDLIYAVPSYHNPTGVCLSADRREALLRLAQRHGVPLLEDDWLADLDPPEGPVRLKAMDAADHVLYLGTASKVLVPGFRLGWLVVPREIFPAFLALKKGADLACNLPGQVVLCRMLQDGSYDAHVDRLRTELDRRRDLVNRTIEASFPAFARPLGVHRGMVLWIQLPPELDVGRIVEAAHQQGIEITAGKPFDPQGQELPGFRISYATAEDDQLEPALQSLGAILKDAGEQSSRSQALPLV